MRKIKRAPSLEEISRKLDLIMSKLEVLEQIVLADPKYSGSLESLRLTKMFLGLYDEPLKILSRLKVADFYTKREPIVNDEISRYIIQALAIKGDLNISSITREVQSMRGRASRRIIRERLKRLEKENIVKRIEGFGSVYRLTEPKDINKVNNLGQQ
ncbi:MAG: hypothetical protein QXU95_04035 [Candidatus Bathyarchaeia archaeon]|nr:hypothetical protein [Candidatus Bathyarchaeota archaeon]